MTSAADFRYRFVDFAIKQNALCFGEFKTKAGRQSPYFFNSGLFSDGASLASLTRFYAEAALASDIQFDMLFGPAYKGITQRGDGDCVGRHGPQCAICLQ